jgi:hypothetical protein
MSRMIEAFIKRRRAELEARDGGRWIIQRQKELEKVLGPRKPGKPKLFLVPKPKPEPEQLDLDFTSEDQRELERAMSAILERTQNGRKPKVG